MILLYSHHQRTKVLIETFLGSVTDQPIVFATTDQDLVALAREHRPGLILLFMPARPGTARDIQAYLLGILAKTRVRILPRIDCAHPVLTEWQAVIKQALRPRQSKSSDRKTTQS